MFLLFAFVKDIVHCTGAHAVHAVHMLCMCYACADMHCCCALLCIAMYCYALLMHVCAYALLCIAMRVLCYVHREVLCMC